MYVTQDPRTASRRVSISEHRAAGRRRLLAAPLWISLQLMMIAVIVMGLLVQGEYVMMRLVIDELLPGATADQRTAVGIVVTLAYLIVWASVGFCVAPGKRSHPRSEAYRVGKSRGWPQYGSSSRWCDRGDLRALR